MKGTYYHSKSRHLPRIIEMALAGNPTVDIAREVGLTRERVRQILVANDIPYVRVPRGARNPPKALRPCARCGEMTDRANYCSVQCRLESRRKSSGKIQMAIELDTDQEMLAFRALALSKGVTYRQAMMQAVRLWMEANP